jgi:DNA-binding FrmR family transcriptional regulator
MGALMVEVLDSHIREHLLAGGRPRGQGRDEATEELIAILRSYLK